MFTFERYRPGETYGSHQLRVDAELMAQWELLYPEDRPASGSAPAGILSIMILQAYTRVITPRPPGNIHGGQRFEVTRLPRLGETVTTSIGCEAKEIRKGRCFVHLRSESVGDACDPICVGRFTSIVAQPR